MKERVDRTIQIDEAALRVIEFERGLPAMPGLDSIRRPYYLPDTVVLRGYVYAARLACNTTDCGSIRDIFKDDAACPGPA